jgi:hypothetical protein
MNTGDGLNCIAIQALKRLVACQGNYIEEHTASLSVVGYSPLIGIGDQIQNSA